MAIAFLGIAAVLAVLYLFVLPSKKGAVAATTAPALAPAQGPVTSIKHDHPLWKHLQVTGLRINEDEKGRAQVQFVVVNHSGADLPELKLHIYVRGSDKDLFNFEYSIPALGPFESKECSTAVKLSMKPYELPDWQYLNTDFEIESAP